MDDEMEQGKDEESTKVTELDLENFFKTKTGSDQQEDSRQVEQLNILSQVHNYFCDSRRL